MEKIGGYGCQKEKVGEMISLREHNTIMDKIQLALNRPEQVIKMKLNYLFEEIIE